MRYISLLLLVVLSIFAFGCTSLQQETKPLEEENLEILDLKKSISEMDMKIEEINNKLFILQEKVNTNRDRIEALELEREKITVIPPVGLKVVKLKDEEEKVEEEEAAEEAEEEKEALTPEEIYNRGRELLKAGRNGEARKTFSEFVERFPSHALADNALYWIGESFYSERNFKDALESFTAVVDRYPDENKAPDAMLKMAYSYMELKEKARAEETLKELMDRYPLSEAAEKAEKRLGRP